MIMTLTVFKEVHNTWPAKNGKPAGESYDLLCMDNSNPPEHRMEEMLYYRTKDDGRPAFPGQHRPRQPRHVEGEVLHPAQKDVGANRSVFQSAQEVFRAGFQDWKTAYRIECLVAHGSLPANQGRPLFQSGRLVHDVLPGAGGDLRVAGCEIGAGDLQVDGGLSLRLVLGVKQSPGLGPVAGVEAGLLAGGRVFAIEDFTALKQDEPLSHVDAFRF